MTKGLAPNRWVQTVALALPIITGLSTGHLIIGIICSLVLFWIFRGET